MRPWFNTVFVFNSVLLFRNSSLSLLSLLNHSAGEIVVSLRQCAESANCSNALIAWRQAQGRSQEFCWGVASHWRRQISNFSYFAQRSFWCHWSISGLLQQDMTSNIFYQSASINFNKDKRTFAFAVIIIKQLLTKQFSMNIKSSGKRSAV